MKNVYLFLSAIGFILPNIYVGKVTYETGNILFWTDPQTTINGMFANDYSTAFGIDLLVVVYVFMIWAWSKRKIVGTKKVFLSWAMTWILGMAGPFPLFMYWLEIKKAD